MRFVASFIEWSRMIRHTLLVLGPTHTHTHAQALAMIYCEQLVRFCWLQQKINLTHPSVCKINAYNESL